MKPFSKFKLWFGLLLKWMKHVANCTDLTLSDNWIPLLKALQIFGNAPIQITMTSDNMLGVTLVQSIPNQKRTTTSKYEFKIRWRSIGTIYTLLMTVIRAFIELSQFMPIESNLRYYFVCMYGTMDQREFSETEKVVSSWPYYCIPVLGVIERISTLACLSNFVKFLTNWQVFHEIIGQSKDLPCSIVKWKQCRRLVYLALITFLPTFGIEFVNVAEGLYFGRGLTNCGSMIYSVWIAFAQLAILTENLKVLFMCQAVSTAMCRIRVRVEECIDGNASTESIRKMIRMCQKAHSLLKEQVHLIGSSQGLHELSFVCYLLLVITMHIFLTLSPIFRGEIPNKFLLFNNFAHLLEGLMRLYMKCHCAEEITKQEKLLAGSLVSLELCNIPEAKLLAASIAWNPTKVVYGSMITMDKRLIVKIANQIVTYIIILLQFQISYKTNKL